MKRKEDTESVENPLPHKLSKHDLYKAPTNEELHQLKDAETVFQSSLFRLQVTELLKEVYVKHVRRQQVDTYIEKLADVLTRLAKGEKHLVSSNDWLDKTGVTVPLSLGCAADVKGSFQFFAPSTVRMVGSFPLGTCLKPQACADIVLEIPKECIEPKDYLNFRYLRKRALYLAVVAGHLKKHDLVDHVSYTWMNGDKKRAVLVLTPSGKLGHHIKVHVHTRVGSDVMKKNRFDIRKNNVRSEWYYGHSVLDKGADEPATPLYNTCMLKDLCMYEHDLLITQTIDGAQSVLDGIALLKVWLRRRELIDAGFTGYIMTLYVIYLMKKHKLSPMMTSYQIMRNTLLHFVSEDWTTRGITLCSSTEPALPGLSDFHTAFPVVFVDNTGYVNICAEMRADVLLQTRHEAELAIQMLTESGSEAFKLLFMTALPFNQQFDHYIKIVRSSVYEQSVTKLNILDKLMDHAGDTVAACLPRILQLLQKAVDDRVKQFVVQPTSPVMWSVDKTPPSGQKQVTIGVRVNSDHYMRVLTKGPPADSAEAKAFREFWGSVSELRRFQDGNICEAVVWTTGDRLSRRRVVVGNIVKHILARHTDIPPDCVRYTGDELDDVLSLKHSAKLAYGTGEEESGTVLASYDQLAKLLRNLPALPLSFVTLQGVSPVFRHAEVFPGFPAVRSSHSSDLQLPVVDKPCPTYIHAHKVMCTLEGSGKWPDDVAAIQRLKTAMLIQVARQLNSHHHLVAQLVKSGLLVVKDGFVFELQLSYPREIGLMKEVRSPEGQIQIRDTEESTDTELKTITLPKLSSALLGVHQANATFSSVVRLAKRWISSQLLWHYICEEAVELLVTYLFVCPLPFNAPRSPVVGFMRFLSLISSHDWSGAPIIVNFNQELKQNEISEIQQQFTRERASLPAMFISSPYDQHQSLLTREGPDEIILHRLTVLAKHSLHILQEQQEKMSLSEDFKLIFRPPLDHYDVVIHLRHKHCPRYYQAIDSDHIHPYLQAEHQVDTSTLPVVNFDPVQIYLQELKSAFSDVALFFQDIYGGDVIGVLWKPHLHDAQSFKVSNMAHRMVHTTKHDVQLVANFEAYLEDFRVLGQGLVDKVESKIKISAARN